MLRLIIPIGMRTSNLVKVDILLNATVVDAFFVNSRRQCLSGKKMCEKLKELIPRQQFDIQFKPQLV
jgi:GTP-binding protein LepA